MNRLEELHDAGVSIWLDSLSRDLLESGGFRELVDDFAVSGATSNPTIFAKAIGGSEPLRRAAARAELRRASATRRSSSSPLALEDVRERRAILRADPRANGGRDGFVSFECTPDLADDAEATVAQALELWRRLDLPNVLIKVPATAAGVAPSRS